MKYNLEIYNPMIGVNQFEYSELTFKQLAEKLESEYSDFWHAVFGLVLWMSAGDKNTFTYWNHTEIIIVAF